MKHRTALVSAMSIAGVVLAGATAVGANLGILGSSQGLGEISAVQPATTSIAAATPPIPSTMSQPDLVAYQINGVGVVTIARQGSELTLDSADVGSWTYEVSGQGETLAMAFRFEEREVRFEAALADGQIVVDVWEEQVIVTPGADPGSPATPATAPVTQATSVTTPSPTTSGTWSDDDDDGYEHDDADADASYDSSYDSDDDGGDDDD
ncbi:MAG: hypothetical protein ACFCVC_13020 [Acidimicrobiia bacterium]